ERPLRSVGASTAGRRLFQEGDALLTQVRRRLVEILHDERDMIDGTLLRACGLSFLLTRGEHPHAAVEQQPVHLSLQPAGLSAEHLPIPRQRGGGIRGAEVHMMEAEMIRVFDQLDSRSPWIED